MSIFDNVGKSWLPYGTPTQNVNINTYRSEIIFLPLIQWIKFGNIILKHIQIGRLCQHKESPHVPKQVQNESRSCVCCPSVSYYCTFCTNKNVRCKLALWHNITLLTSSICQVPHGTDNMRTATHNTNTYFACTIPSCKGTLFCAVNARCCWSVSIFHS